MSYNGFKNWNEWNAVLWLNNDEGLYRYLRGLKAELGAEEGAWTAYQELRGTKTPDGALYTLAAIERAMED